MRYRLVLTAAVMVVLATAGGVLAMGPGQEVIHAKIPFRFVIHNKVLNAGEYELFSADINDPNVMVIRATNDGTEETFLVEPAEATRKSPKSELVFDTVGPKRFLRQIWIANERTGQEITLSRDEQALIEKGLRKSGHRVPAKRVQRTGESTS